MVGKEGEGMDLERLLQEHGDSLYRMCVLYLKDEFLAQDAVQDTFLKAMTASFRGECSEKTFLAGIAINVCRDYLRSPWRRRRAGPELLETASAVPAPEPTDDTLPRAVMALPGKYREVVVLYYYQELKAKEVAEALQLSLSTVTVRLTRARAMLKKKLKGWYYDDEQHA